MPQTKGTTTNLTKLVSWDIDEYHAFTDDECYVCLTEKEMYLIRNSLRVMEWWTRWTSELNTALPDIATIAENLAYKVSGEQCLDICLAVKECIESDTDVQNALRDFNQVNDGYNTPANNTIGLSNELINPTDCDMDEMWGNAVALWSVINQTTIDFLEIIAVATNAVEAFSDIVSAIPVIGLLPFDEALGFIDQVATWSLENYNAGLTVGLEQQIQCDLFCIMVNNCGITFEQMFTYFSDFFTEDLTLFTLTQYMVWMTGVLPTGTPIVYLLSCFQLFVVSIAERYLNIQTTDFYKISAQLGEPDNDWETLCDECGWVHTFDFTVDDGGFVAFGVVDPTKPLGTWSSGTGWVFTDNLWSSSPVQYRRGVSIWLDISPDTELTEFSFVYDFTKGSYSGGVTALGMGMQLDAVTLASASEPSSTITTGSDKNKVLTSTQTADRVYLLVTSSAQTTAVYSGSVVIKSVTLKGLGLNPFI